MSILECILVDATEGVIKFIANDIDLGIQTEVDGNIIDRGYIAIDAKIFFDIIRKLPDSDVTIEADSNGKVTISCEKAKFSIVGRNADDFTYLPNIERIDGISVSQYTLKNIIQQTIFSIAENDANKMMSGKFGLDDMLAQMRQVQKLGSLGGLLKLIPGMPKISPEQQAIAEKEMRNFEIIINSMTYEERQNPSVFQYSRKIRVANGCGKQVSDVNRVLKKYEQMKDMMKQMEQYKKSGRMPPGMPPGFGGMR